ncbi:MAG: FKBP-type peptidyl-prolyl cis-trans isomerase [Bacteroidota bacterium]
MKTIALTLGFVAFSFLTFGQKGKSKKVVLKNKIDSVSYLMGVNIGNSLGKEMSEANFDLIVQGFRDAIAKGRLVCQDSTDAILSMYFQEKAMMKQAEEDEKNEVYKIAGEKFMADNAKKAGVKTTASGLQYQVIKEGEGGHPTAESKVKVHYHGTTIEGIVFDSSVDRGEPIEFGLNQVIPGWTEGVQLMTKGAKYKFYIPQELAYGSSSPTPTIKPFSPLVFEVELLSFE